MNSEWFEKVIKQQIKTCEDVLIGKAKEYATDDDRLHNFKNAAGMMSCDPKEALAGMMAKHTISVYDMCRNGKDYPIELWNEKITDHINYLLLLKAVVEEEKSPVGKNREYSFTDFVKDIWPNYRSQLNCIHDTTCKPEEDHTLTVAYGEVPTFDGKPVEIKKPEISIDEVIKGLTICKNGDCKDCPYNDAWGISCCVDKLKEDAAKLLETYREIVNFGSPKESNDAIEYNREPPKIKEDPSALDEAIEDFRITIECCTNANCESCFYYDSSFTECCSKRLLDEFDNIIIRLKEQHNA